MKAKRKLAVQQPSPCRRNNGFTMIELLLALSILALISVVCFMTFSTVLNSWRRGTELADNMQHGDFVMDQLVMGLRSAYFPATTSGMSDYGFELEDFGTGEYGGDKISWTKLGSALVGSDCPFAGSPHRVQFYIDDDEEGELSVTVKSWRIQGQMEDFDSEKIKPTYLSRRIRGFNCRPAFEKVEGEYEFLDEWEHTNNLPLVVELTLYFEPVGKSDKPVEVKRVVQIPVAKPFTASGVAATGGDNSPANTRTGNQRLRRPGGSRGRYPGDNRAVPPSSVPASGSISGPGQ